VGKNSLIQWTYHTYNPWQGCLKVSPGCDNCYMYRDKIRYGQDPEKVVRSKPPTFNKPLKWNREAEAAGRVDLVFVASWADFFAREADGWRDEAWAIIRQCKNLVFQILTKRHARIERCLPPDWGEGYENVWLGVSAENAEWWNRRVPILSRIPARVRFVSYEPALGPITGCSAAGIDWVIIGGESGHDARPFVVGWALEAFDICRRDGAAPFLKQLGALPQIRLGGPGEMCPVHERCDCLPPLVSLRGLVPVPVGDQLVRIVDSHGGNWDEWPADLRVREYPQKKGIR